MKPEIKLVLMLAVVVAMIGFAAFAFDAFDPQEPVPTSEIPYRYEVDAVSSMENGTYAVRLSTVLRIGEDIPIKGSGIEINYFIVSDENIDVFFEDNGGDGQWQIYTFSTNGERDVGIIWESDNIPIGGTITLPIMGERVTLLGFDPEGNPLFEIE